MVKTEPTDHMITAGAEFVRQLDSARLEVIAGLWFYETDEETWRFIVGSPEVRTRGSNAVYRKIENVLGKLGDARSVFSLGVIRAVKDVDPLLNLLRIAVRTGPGIHNIRFTRSSVNGHFVEDAYIYRLL